MGDEPGGSAHRARNVEASIALNSRYEQIFGNGIDVFAEEAAFIRTMFLRMGVGEAAAVLDLGSGIGLHAISAAAIGHKVTIVDVDAAALKRVKALAEGRGLAISALQADLRSWRPHVSARFDVIMCLGNVLLLFDSLSQVEDLLNHVWHCAAVGGHLLVGMRRYRPARPVSRTLRASTATHDVWQSVAVDGPDRVVLTIEWLPSTGPNKTSRPDAEIQLRLLSPTYSWMRRTLRGLSPDVDELKTASGFHYFSITKRNSLPARHVPSTRLREG